MANCTCSQLPCLRQTHPRTMPHELSKQVSRLAKGLWSAKVVSQQTSLAKCQLSWVFILPLDTFSKCGVHSGLSAKCIGQCTSYLCKKKKRKNHPAKCNFSHKTAKIYIKNSPQPISRSSHSGKKTRRHKRVCRNISHCSWRCDLDMQKLHSICQGF